MRVNDTRTLSPVAQEELRRRVVHAVLVQDMKKSHAARTFKVSRASIDHWLDIFQHDGEKALAARKRGPKVQSRLKPRQLKQITNAICGKCPDQLKLPFALWTREAVQQFLSSRFGIAVSVWTAGRYLKAWGFSPQRPARRAYEQDPVAVKRWLQEEYPAIKARAKQEKARIRWCDEMGLRSDHQSGTSWGRVGCTPVIPGAGKRFGCSMISAISNRGELAFMVYTQRFTGPVFIRFLHRLRRLYRKKTFLIVDGHPTHRATLVKRYLAKYKDNIELFFLPGYSPQLNPDELLNQDTKANALSRRRPRDQQEMIRDTRAHLRSRQRSPKIVANFFQEKHVQYAA
jgi:transposase